MGLEDQAEAAKERLAISDFLTKRELVGTGSQLATTPGTSSGWLPGGDGEGWTLAGAGDAQVTHDRIRVEVPEMGGGPEPGLGLTGPHEIALGESFKCDVCKMPASHALPIMLVNPNDLAAVPSIRRTFCVKHYEETLEDLIG